MRFDSIDHVSYKDVESRTVITQIEAYLTQTSKSIILLNTQARIPDALLTYLVKLESKGIRYLSTESFLEQYLQKCYIPEDQTNISFLEKIKPYSPGGYFLKRLVDFIGVLVIGVLTSPVMLYAAYRIRKESPGDTLFRQDRVGLNGKTFTCYKFRSMHEDSYHDPYTRENDSRIFPWGNTMRKTRIDELPQLWNVLRGDMHILGPRAEWDILVENYEHDIPYYHERHLVRPGITGWAQVNYPYGANTEDAKQKLMYDLYYIKYWSLWLEIKTAWKTIKIVLGKKGM
jgi:lipopolysaccharide/colanic/teichoic acid biosynthesis glycosyltransferase